MNNKYYQELSSTDKMLVEKQVDAQGKNMVLAYILGWFLLGTGAAQYYLGNKKLGNTQLFLFLFGLFTTVIFIGFIPLSIAYIMGFIDLFTIYKDVNTSNELLRADFAKEIYNRDYRKPVQDFKKSNYNDKLEKDIDIRIKEAEDKIVQNKNIEDKLNKLRELEKESQKIPSKGISLEKTDQRTVKTTEELTKEIFEELENKNNKE